MRAASSPWAKAAPAWRWTLDGLGSSKRNVLQYPFRSQERKSVRAVLSSQDGKESSLICASDRTVLDRTATASELPTDGDRSRLTTRDYPSADQLASQ